MMLENALVVLIVAMAAAYAAWKFTPQGLRRRLVPGIVGCARVLGITGQRALRLESKLASAGACGSCNSCNACATDPSELGEPVLPAPKFSSEPLARVIAIVPQPGERPRS